MAGQPAESDTSTAIALSEPPVSTQPLSPGALEDLRSAPTNDLEVLPPILPPPLPEDIAEPETIEEPAIAEQTPPAQEEGMETDDEFSLGEALASYLIAMRNELNREYVEDCIEFRSHNGLGADCPDNLASTAGINQEERALVDDLFAIITRESENAQISSRLERENETLAAILDDPANPAANQASTKMALNNSYLAYLNGNPNPTVEMFRTMNDFINDYNRTIMSGPFQYRCQGGTCVYEYTGPEAE